MKHYSYLIFLFFLNGCFYKRVPVPDTISLVNYPTQLKDANDQNKKEHAAAWEDFILASNRCRLIHNNYEIGYKNAEQAKLILGGLGGVAGLTGAVLATSGSAVVVGAIAAGVSGLASMTLGNAEKRPIGYKLLFISKGRYCEANTASVSRSAEFRRS